MSTQAPNRHPPSKRAPYRRPMTGWWQRDPFFIRYMLREATALAVAVYAGVLALGLLRLAQGEAAWNAWLQALRSPASIVLHALLLLGSLIHAYSWFQIMPKTLPLLFWQGRLVPASLIQRLGWLAAVSANALLLALAWVWQR